MTRAAVTAMLLLLLATIPTFAQEPETLEQGDEAHAGAAEEDPLALDEPAPIELTPEQEARAHEIENELKCPVCRSQSIRQSRSFMADDMRRKVRQLVAEGKSNQEIRDYFVDRYGQYIVLAPPKSGFNLAAWLLPFFVVAIGAAGLFVAAHRWRREERPEEEEDDEPPTDDPYMERLERELEEAE